MNAIFALILLVAIVFSKNTAETVNFKVTFDGEVDGNPCQNAANQSVPCPNMKMAAIIDGTVTDHIIRLHYSGFEEMDHGTATGRKLGVIPADYAVTDTDLGNGNWKWEFTASLAGLCGPLNCTNSTIVIETFVSGKEEYTTPRGFTMSPNTVKTAVNVTNWPFAVNSDYLRIKFRFTGENLPKLHITEDETSDQYKLRAETDSELYTFVQLYDKGCSLATPGSCSIKWEYVKTSGHVMVYVDVPRDDNWMFYDPEVYNGASTLSVFLLLLLALFFQF